MVSSDDEDLVLALALSAREAATGGSSSRQGLSRPPPVRGDDLIELGDSSDEDGSDDEIQILDDAPPPTRASASSARHDPTSRRENALASSSRAAAAVTNGIGRPLSSSGRAGMRSGLVDANAVRRDDLRLRDAAELARLRYEAEQALGAATARSAGGSSIAQSGVRLGGRPGPPLRPQQPAESFEEGGMDAEMMLALHKSREEEEHKRIQEEKQRALMAETDEEEALRLAIEASLNAPPPPAADGPSRKRVRSVSSTSSVTQSSDDGGERDPEATFKRELDDAVRASKAERRKLVIPRAIAGGTGSGPLFGQPGLYEAGGRLSGTSTPIVDVNAVAPRPAVTTATTGAAGPRPPLRASTLTMNRPAGPQPMSQADITSPTPAPSLPAPAAVGLPTGATRAQMEAERLQRVQARQVATNAGSGIPSSTASSEGGPSAPKRARLSSPGPSQASEPTWSSNSTTSKPPLSERFWQGTLGMSHNTFASSGGPDEAIKRSFRLRDLISEPENLVFTIFSTYCIEPAFLAQCLPHPKRAPVILVSHPPTKEWAGKSDQSRILPGVWDRFPWITFGSCHMKFMLLWYIDGHMRIVITTANFFAHDWESIENIVWVQDFKPRTAAGKQRSDFGEQWVEILKALGVPKSFAQVRASLEDDPRQLAKVPFTSLNEIADRWDFSTVTVKLIASLAGKREGWDELDSSGIGRLGKVLREEGWIAPAGKELTALEAQGSSIGEYTRPWTNVVWKMVRGEEPRRFLRAAVDSKEHAEGLKVVFPTLRTVDATVLGRPGGGTLFCNAKKFATRPTYFHDAVSKRGARTLMHLKILTGVFDPLPQTLGGRSGSSAAPASRKPPLKQQKLFDSASESSATEDDEARIVPIRTAKGKKDGPSVSARNEPAGGFMYIGSHNFTPSAWGRVTMAKSATQPTLTIQNYELGILFPLREADAQAHASSLAPYQRPVKPYRKDDVPWCMEDHMPQGI